MQRVPAKRYLFALFVERSFAFFVFLFFVDVSFMATASTHPEDGVVVRLHLVRHGETVANRANLVLGQAESPLTEKGLSQARSLGAFLGPRYPFWRVYSSDFIRTRTTAATILTGDTIAKTEVERMASAAGEAVPRSSEAQIGGESGRVASAVAAESVNVEKDKLGPKPSFDGIVRQDERLRERAKGVREGRPKSLTYEEALRLHLEERGVDEVGDEEVDLPLLESDDDVWARVKNWIDELVRDASKIKETDDEHDVSSPSHESTSGAIVVDATGREFERDPNSLAKSNADWKDRGSAVDPRSTEQLRRRVYEVLAVSHSATIRTSVNRLVGEQLPSSVGRGPVGKDGIAPGMLVVPNTSRTVIDIVVTEDSTNGDDEDIAAKGDGSDATPKWSANLVELTNTDHLTSS